MEEINLANLKITQLGYVYKDIEKQAKLIEQIFGVPKINIIDVPELSIIFRGSESKIHLKMAFTQIGDMQIELIQWVDGDSLYKEFIEQGKEGLQHYGVYAEGLEKFVEEMKKKGFQSIQSGKIASAKYDYFDTTDVFGVFFELIEQTSRRSRRKKK